MAVRSLATRFTLRAPSQMAAIARRCFSDGKGRVFSEEEKAAENIYIQKMERERMEKMKQKAEKEKAEAEKNKTEKKPESS